MLQPRDLKPLKGFTSTFYSVDTFSRPSIYLLFYLFLFNFLTFLLYLPFYFIYLYHTFYSFSDGSPMKTMGSLINVEFSQHSANGF